ncbi:MAG: hypothetical protein ACIAS6_11750 [Phycisphaerales bacterium JB060]
MAAQPRQSAVVALLIALCLVTGCQSSQRYQGQSRIVATWQGRTLSAEVPDAVGVPGAHYAAVEALLARGYALEADEATADRGYVAASGPDGTMLGSHRRVVVRTALTPAAVGIRITLEPVGDEVAARAILDDVLRRLGQ